MVEVRILPLAPSDNQNANAVQKNNGADNRDCDVRSDYSSDLTDVRRSDVTIVPERARTLPTSGKGLADVPVRRYARRETMVPLPFDPILMRSRYRSGNVTQRFLPPARV